MSNPNRPLPPKKEVALELLEGPSLYIHLDPRKADVAVPAYFKKQPQLVLQVGRDMAVPIPDLKIDDGGVSCTLSFNRSPFWCNLPWSAIYALVGEDGRAMVWPSEVPSEVAAQMERAAKQPTPEASPARPRAAREGKRRGVTALRSEGSSAPRAADVEPDRAPAALKDEADRRNPESTAPELPNVPAAPLAEGASPQPARPLDARHDAGPSRKGKRELPPYLRVVK